MVISQSDTGEGMGSGVTVPYSSQLIEGLGHYVLRRSERRLELGLPASCRLPLGISQVTSFHRSEEATVYEQLSLAISALIVFLPLHHFACWAWTLRL
jgi:hypothetical protein